MFLGKGSVPQPRFTVKAQPHPQPTVSISVEQQQEQQQQKKKKPKRKPKKKKKKGQDQNQCVFFVLDTNCMLVAKPLVLHLLKKENVFIVIPYVVYKELDGIKKRNDTVGQAARFWIRILCDQFIRKTRGQEITHKNLIIQDKTERMPFGDENKKTNNDDLIWNCAQYYTLHSAEVAKRYKTPPARVALVTEDNHLAINAMRNNVETFLLRELKNTPLSDLLKRTSQAAK